MTEEWVTVALSDDRAVLQVDTAGQLYKPETDRAMTVFYRALATYAERRSTARTPEDVAAVRAAFEAAIDDLERALRL